MRGYSRLSFICLLYLQVIFSVQEENTPQYVAVIDQGNPLFPDGKANPLGQNATPSETHKVLLMKVFPKPPVGMIRRKREWVIPPVNIPENYKGPFPKQLVQMKSTEADSKKMIYKIRGPGADQPPRGLFIVDRNSGMLSVTKKLDREETQKYILKIHGSEESGNYTEFPANIVINVIDDNDNKPVCTHNPFNGEVPELSQQNVSVIQVTAEDLDDPNTENGIVHYKLVGQEPGGDAFHIDPTSGIISVASSGTLDRETHPVYKLNVEAADGRGGHGFSATCMVIIRVTDRNDYAPRFSQQTFVSTVQENKVGEIVARLAVTDRDEPLTPNSMVKFTIIEGNEEGFFNISTSPNKMEGTITTLQGLDFEQSSGFSLLVVVENLVPFVVTLPTSTATVTITVQDVNEPPVFEPTEKRVTVSEDLPVGSTITRYTARDPDTARQQNIRYKLLKDFANWLEIAEDTGHVKVRSSLDREASFIRNGEYTVLVVAYDNDDEPATGTGTLIIELSDVNDNSPVLEQRRVQMCSTEPKPVRLTITDQDGPENSAPFRVELHSEYQNNWTVFSNTSRITGDVVWLKTLKHLDVGEYHLLLRVYDSQMLFQDSSVMVEMCDCEGDDVKCLGAVRGAIISSLSVYVLTAIFCLLVLLLLLLLLLKRKSGRKQKPFIQKEEDRDNILCYNEEGGGEEDQDYDISLLHTRGPEVFPRDVSPTDLPTIFYRHYCEDNEDIGNFISNNLYTADNELYAAPRDSLLVFGYEGGGSNTSSLSSLQSSSSDGSQDYQQLQHWGSPFRRLADMFAGEEDE